MSTTPLFCLVPLHATDDLKKVQEQVHNVEIPARKMNNHIVGNPVSKAEQLARDSRQDTCKHQMKRGTHNVTLAQIQSSSEKPAK